ncbi:MAG: MFS transporter, partial [Bacteroidota bacterium]|nr:MFS transporter [Bacteroidota bacterium]
NVSFSTAPKSIEYLKKKLEGKRLESKETLLIGIGAVVGSWLPYILSNWMGVSNEPAREGLIAPNVSYSFYFGAFVLLSAIIWTIVSTKEYPPEFYQDKKEKTEEEKPKFRIPKVMWQLLLVQFFSWFALFSMWVFTTPAVADHFYGTSDPNSVNFQKAGDWVGILFGIYNGVSAIIALSLPKIAKRIGRKSTHALALSIGGLSFISFLIIPNPTLLIIPMVGIGIAWGSILAMPYAMLANSIPPKQMGMFMGLFNMSITIPQIVNGIFGGIILHKFFNDNAMLSLVMAGVFMILGAISTLLVNDKQSSVLSRQ